MNLLFLLQVTKILAEYLLPFSDILEARFLCFFLSFLPAKVRNFVTI